MKVSFVSASFLLVCGAQAAPLYSVIDLGTLGGATSFGYGINDLGQVTGYSNVASGKGHAFVYTPGTGMADLGTYGNKSESFGYGINAAGRVAGTASSPGGQATAVRYTSGTGYQDLGNLGYPSSQGRAINDSGQVAGYAAIPGAALHAFRYTDGVGLADLGTLGGSTSHGYDINAGGQVVGSSTAANGFEHAFRYAEGVGMVDLGALAAANLISTAFGINDLGQVTGYVRTAGGGRYSYLYTDGDTTLHNIGNLAGKSFQDGNALNNAGWVVGSAWSGQEGDATSVAFLYTATDGTLNLNTLLDGSGTGWSLRSATAISNTGYITGYGVNALGQTHAFLLAPQAVPEPATLATLGVAALALVGRRRSGRS
jgi:probable HAF family extracellular repeat protein